MKVIKELTIEGKSIVLITHKLKEIKQIADRCTILRNGKAIATVNVAEVTSEALAEMMVGRKVSFKIDKQQAKPKEKIFTVKNLTIESEASEKPIVDDVSFSVRKGEILCIAGIEGNGQTELIKAITGLMPYHKGKIILNDIDITNLNIRQKTLTGIAHIPEDRHKYGLILEYNLAENLILQTYFFDRFQKLGFLKYKNIYQYAKKLIERFDIRSGKGIYSIVRNMSGGNQQKAIIAREIDRNPDLLIAVQPTRGLDVGAIEYIHKEIIKHRDKGKAVLLVSLELDEVFNLSDRIIVMYEGEIVADLDPKETTENELGLYMSGSKRGVVNE